MVNVGNELLSTISDDQEHEKFLDSCVNKLSSIAEGGWWDKNGRYTTDHFLHILTPFNDKLPHLRPDLVTNYAKSVNLVPSFSWPLVMLAVGPNLLLRLADTDDEVVQEYVKRFLDLANGSALDQEWHAKLQPHFEAAELLATPPLPAMAERVAEAIKSGEYPTMEALRKQFRTTIRMLKDVIQEAVKKKLICQEDADSLLA